MQDILGASLRMWKKTKARRMRIIAIMLVLSLIVSLDVFWVLRQPGWTLAGNADCGITEHTHDSRCQAGGVHCTLTEHVHSVDCYSNESADTETQLDWQKIFADYPYTGDLQKDLVGIAKTQVGYTESKENFRIDGQGVRHGYTRYGAWYGAPYGDWSAMFVSYCLHFAGADPGEFPGNTGAASMAELWTKLGKFAPAGAYQPTPGDLVFFKDNTVGIVTEVQLATICVIRGDVDDGVRSAVMLPSDSSISGWGITKKSQITVEKPPDTGQEIDLLDISQGPAFFIFDKGEEKPRIVTYSFRARQTVIDLLAYLEANGGSYFFTLLDQNNQELPKDADGNYIAQANKNYKLTVTLNVPEGFVPGVYQYQIPNGLMVDGGEGDFVLKDGTNVGSWVVTDTGLITLEFNENINSRTDITISMTMGMNFPEQDEPLDFDGKITVTVEKPPPVSNPTFVNKWGNQGGVPGSNGADPNKIYWGVEIIGNKDSQIPGNILTDSIILGEWSESHRFTESDMADGLTIGVSENGNWHSWVVTADDPHLVWSETGWSYKMPTVATCQWCGALELGNEGWYYYINYTSTPDRTNTAGTFGYENQATIDGAYGYAWVNFTHGEVTGEIIKNGSFISDAAGGAFLWEFQATIPGRAEGQRAEYHWYIMDYMNLLNHDNIIVDRVENDAHLAMVFATYNGQTIPIPRIQDATDEDLFAWDNAWTATENGINYGREFNILCRCQCTPDTCHWGGGCGDYWYIQDDGTTASKDFCQCWTPTETITFTFVYRTEDLSVVERYGGLGYKLLNEARLYYKPDESPDGALVSTSTATVPIPGVFKKELTHDFNGYTAHYMITVNEAKLVLTNGAPLTIHDVMTSTLAFINGSLVITTEDVNGNTATLQQGTDFTVTYDGTGKEKDESGNPVHVLDIVILRPQPVMYILDYDTTLLLPEQVTSGIKYSNSATVTLWGKDVTDTSNEKVYADINIAANTYRLELFKTSALTGEPLGGATFGVYNQQGGLITTGTTDANGRLLFQTNTVEGIIFREHVLYYAQELVAPPGYQLDRTKHWFCFCNETGTECGVYKEILAGVDVVRIPYEQIGELPITNDLQSYDLPATGGPGIYPLILVSVILIVTPLVYMSVQRRKRERRGVG